MSYNPKSTRFKTETFRQTFQNNSTAITTLSGLLEEFNHQNQVLHEQIIFLSEQNRVMHLNNNCSSLSPAITHPNRSSHEYISRLTERSPTVGFISIPTRLNPSIPAKYGYFRKERLNTDYSRGAIKRQYLKTENLLPNSQRPYQSPVSKNNLKPLSPVVSDEKKKVTVTSQDTQTQFQHTPDFKLIQEHRQIQQRRQQQQNGSQIRKLLESSHQDNHSLMGSHQLESSIKDIQAHLSELRSQIKDSPLKRTNSNTLIVTQQQNQVNTCKIPQKQKASCNFQSPPAPSHQQPQHQYTFSKVIIPSVHRTSNLPFQTSPVKFRSYVISAIPDLSSRTNQMNRENTLEQQGRKKRYLSLVSSSCEKSRKSRV